MNKGKSQVVLALMCSLTILLSGCTKESSQTGKEHDEIKKENTTLAKENSKLEGKYEELEEQVEVLKQELDGLTSMLESKEIDNTQDNKELVSIPIYTKKPDSDEVIVDKPNTMRSDLTLKEKLESLVDTLSELKFTAFNIEIESLEGKHAVIKIKEKNEDSYEDSGINLYFENEVKSEESKTSLVETLLQRNYKGEWIESVRIIYEGPETWRNNNTNIQKIEQTYNR